MPHGSLVAEIDRYAAAVPIVLVSDRAAPAIEALSAIRFAGIVWRDDVPRRLVPSIREAVVHTRYRTMARRVGAAQLPPLLTRALVLALRTAGGEPIRKPAELAAALRCSPITLSQEFRRAVGGAFTLDDFLGAIQVMRVSQLRAVRTPWADVEDVVRFTVRSIRRKATRWPGCTLKQLQMIDPGELRRRFEKERLARLLDCAS
ncbi:MAG: hypothetical protein MJB57_11515 [Gemmatimonadetes bacterium]|nr:hypothetical protein [Gemmatimonadota bacterium]